MFDAQSSTRERFACFAIARFLSGRDVKKNNKKQQKPRWNKRRGKGKKVRQHSHRKDLSTQEASFLKEQLLVNFYQRHNAGYFPPDCETLIERTGMLQLAPSIFPHTEGTPTPEFERVIGIECRAPYPPQTSANTATQWPSDVLVATFDGRRTKIEAIRCVFAATGALVEHRKCIVVLDERRDIVHASCSEPGPNNEMFLSFTERYALPAGRHRHISGLSARLAAAADDEGGATGVAAAAAPGTSAATFAAAATEYRYQLWIHVVGTKVIVDASVAIEKGTQLAPGALAPDQCRQVGYMLRSPPRKEIFWLRASDHCVAGLQIKQLTYKPKQETVELRCLLEWNLAQFQLWHQWDPFTQRIMFWAALPYYKFRVVRITGHPENRRCEFEQNVGKLNYPLWPGLPFPVPYGTANSTSCVNYHIVVIPIRYECDSEDYALCRQLLPNASTAAQPDSYMPKIICTVTLLRNAMDSVEVDIELDRPLLLYGNNYRVTFLFVGGMIAIYLPHVFVHYIDVSHKEVPPKYLFGVSLGGGGTSGSVQRPTAGSGSPRPSIVGCSSGAIVSGGGFQSETTQFSWSKRADSLSPRGGGAGCDQRQSGDAPLACSHGTNRTHSSGADNESVCSSMQPAAAVYACRECVVALPVPSGNWLLLADSACVFPAHLTRAALWNVIGDRMHYLSLRGSNNSATKQDVSSLLHALHVVTTHLQPQQPPAALSTKGKDAPAVVAAVTTPHPGEDFFANHLRRLICDHWREIRPSFLTQLIIGEAYCATRSVCKAHGNPFYLCMPMNDDQGIHLLLEEHNDREWMYHVRLRSGVGGGTQLSVGHPQPHGGHLGCPGQGGKGVRAESRREPDGRVRDLCHNTDPDWWLLRGIKLNTTLFTRIRTLGKSNVTPVVRISIGEQHAASRPAAAAAMAYSDVLAARLRAVGVPQVPSTQTASAFAMSVTKVVDDILEIVSKPDKEISARAQFHFLHHVALAVHLLGIRFPQELVDRFASLAAKTLSSVIVLHGIKAGVYSPSLRVMEHSYSLLRARVEAFLVRHGQKLTERDIAAASATTRLPLTLLSPDAVANSSGFSDAMCRAETDARSPPPNGNEPHPPGAPESACERPSSTRHIPRYDRCRTSVRLQAVLHLTPHCLIATMSLMNAISCATMDSDIAPAVSAELKTAYLGVFECGPQLQLGGRKAVGKDVVESLGQGLSQYPPLRQWSDRGPVASVGARGGPIQRTNSTSSREASPPTPIVARSTQPGLTVTETMRRERARQALEYVLSPFGE